MRRAGGGRARGRAGAVAGAVLLLTMTHAGCSRLPPIRGSLLPPVTAETDTVTLGDRRFAHVAATGRHDVYAQSAAQLPALRAALDAAAQEFARHFGATPRVAVLLFDAPADPYRDFDFAPFVARRTQVLAFVRGRGAQRAGALGVDEGLLAARLAELLLAAYADSVARAQGGGDTRSEARALDRLPHWFTEAVVSRVARPEAVARGVTLVRANRPRLLPLRRLFALARQGMPTWSELARDADAVRVDAVPGAHPPAPLLAAESTAFGEFLVSRFGPTYLQALADELLAGRSTEDALSALPGTADGDPAHEAAWRRWLGER